MSTPEEAVDLLIKDLSDRRGLKWAWDDIDEEVRAEIRETWAAIIRGSAVKGERFAIAEWLREGRVLALHGENPNIGPSLAALVARGAHSRTK